MRAKRAEDLLLACRAKSGSSGRSATIRMTVLVLAPHLAFAQARLVRNPSLSADRIAFLFADEIWTMPRAGGSATQLTRGGTARTGPFFSPDGQMVAYSAVSGGATDIFVIPAGGGEPRRVTWHPSAENVVGWSPDGRDVLFSSNRQNRLTGGGTLALYRAHADGSGTPVALPFPMASMVSMSPDGKRAAYVPTSFRRGWKGYRGGTAPYIWIADLVTLAIVKIPHTTASDWNPMWIGNRIYFLSDRDGPVALYAYDVATRAMSRVITNDGFDFMSAANGPDGIVLDGFGKLLLFDPRTRAVQTVSVRIDSTFPALAARQEEMPSRRATRQVVSPSGTNVAVEARGDVFITSTDSGAKARNLTNTPALAERTVSWSTDGSRVAYLSEASGEYELVIRAADGSGTPRTIALGERPGIFSDFKWSPDGRHIAYRDDRLSMWMVDLETGRSAMAGREALGTGGPRPADWSPDGKWLAYTKQMPNHMGAAFLYSIETGKSIQATDGRADVTDPAFDASGQYLYFLASANRPMSTSATMAAFDHPITISAYALILSASGVPPTATIAAGVPTRVDTAGIRSRVVRLPAPARAYQNILTGAPGVVYLVDGNPIGGGPTQVAGVSRSVWRLDWAGADKKVEEVLRDADGFEILGNRSTAVVRKSGRSTFVELAGLRAAQTDAAPSMPAGRSLTIPSLPATIDVRAEWKQIYHETWRLQRDLFYAANYNGLDLAKAEATYAPFVAGLGSRSDLTYLMREMLSNLSVSHLAVNDPPADDTGGERGGGRGRGGGGRGGEAEPSGRAGVLGVDIAVDHDRYRIVRVYRGDVWLGGPAGPLAQPGVDVSEGDYLRSIDGHDLTSADNVDRALDGTAGRAIQLGISKELDGEIRMVTITPAASDAALRVAATIEDARATVDRMSGGKLAYVYVTNTGNEGYDGFVRQYLAQAGKSGVIIDERNNGGGQVADYIIDALRRIPLVQMAPRYGENFPLPMDAIYGPRTMMVNEHAGSGGDILPYMFKKYGVGKLVGKRTWGGTIGSGPVPQLIDGGTINVPHFPIADPDGLWGMEGEGVQPDVVVDLDPKAFAAGRDTQLEAAIKLTLEELKAHPPKQIKRPPPRVRQGKADPPRIVP